MKVLLSTLCLTLALPAPGEESRLWGKAGENWDPAGRLRVGVETRGKSQTDPDGRWFEAISPANLQPPNLHQAQWERRMGVGK